MRTATTALFEAEVELADTVVRGDADVRAAQVAVDEVALDLLARQQPVATDLRTIVACVRMSADLRRWANSWCMWLRSRVRANRRRPCLAPCGRPCG